MRTALLFACLLLPPAATSCGEPEPAQPASPAEEVAAMQAHVAELQASDEHDAPRVKVQHILIGFQGAPRLAHVKRSRDEAQKLAAKIYADLKAGADFTRLMSEHSDDDKIVGVYLMSAAEPTQAELYNRNDMAPAFGDVGWRLEVGEIGVAPHHPDKSPFGWHIIQRLE